MGLLKWAVFFFECLSSKLTRSTAARKNSNPTTQVLVPKLPENTKLVIQIPKKWPDQNGLKLTPTYWALKITCSTWNLNCQNNDSMILLIFWSWNCSQNGSTLIRKKLLRILAFFNTKKKSSSDQNNLPIQSGWVKIQEVFVSPLQSLEYDSIPKSLAAQLLGSNEKKKAMEFGGLVCDFLGC